MITHNSSRHAGRRSRLVEDHVTGRVRVCGAFSSSAVHVVKETLVADKERQELRTLNLALIDAYLYDNVDYFYVMYDIITPADIDLFDRDSVVSIRYITFINLQLTRNIS